MHQKFGKLNGLHRPGENDGHNVILLHGFGADASDLFPLADVLDPEENWNFYFAEAPHEVPIGPMMTGRGWFPISVRDLEGGVDFTQVCPPGLTASAEMVYDMIFELNSERLILGGFSQGAMVSTEVALNNANDVHGLVILSGSLLDEAGWRKKAPNLKGKPLFQSHGTQDSVLPFKVGQRLFEILKEAGVEGGLLSFAGGHDIPPVVVKKVAEFLKTQGQS